MRMYVLRLSIALLSVIALAECGTLREYGQDWLIPKPDPQVGSKRITAKSVFIAPSFSAENVRCGAGFQQDASGRCVKVVHVNHEAQLDFLLQRLNAMYGAPALSHSEKQPLQVNVEIPVETENDTSSVETGGIYTHMVPPGGDISIDLLSSIAEHTTKDVYDVKTPEKNFVPEVLPASEEDESSVILDPSKELFVADEESLVTLPDDDGETTEQLPLDSNKNTNYEALFEKDDEFISATVISEETHVVAATKNHSVVSYKEADKDKDSVHLVSDSETGAALQNKTQSSLTLDIVKKGINNGNNTHVSSKKSHQPVSPMKESSTGEKIVYNNNDPDDEMENMLPSGGFDKNNRTVSKVSEVTKPQESSPVLTSNDKLPGDRNTSVSSTEQLASSQAAHHVSTPNTPEPPGIGGLLNPDYIYMKQGEQTEDTDYRDGDTDYVEVYPEAEDYSNSRTEESIPLSVSTESSAMRLNINNSVGTNYSGSLFDTASGDGNLNEHEFNVDSKDISVNFNQSVSINSTNNAKGSEFINSVSVQHNNRTNASNVAGGFLVDGAGMSPVALPQVQKGSMSSDVTLISDGDFKVGGSVHNVKNTTRNSPVKAQTDIEEVQHIVTSQHGAQVVYSQPSIQVLNVNHDSHGHTLGIANGNEPKTEPKETTNSNSPSHQFHNLSPNPLQHHNSRPSPPVPLPQHPYKFSGRPQSYPYHTYPQFHPQPVRPHDQAGYVRFPADHVQESQRSPPHAQRQEVAGNVVRFPQEDYRPNDKYSRWGNWGGGVEPQRRVWTPPENRRNYWQQNRPARRRPQLSYY